MSIIFSSLSGGSGDLTTTEHEAGKKDATQTTQCCLYTIEFQFYQERGALSNCGRLVEALKTQVLLCGVKLAIEHLGNRSTSGIHPLHMGRGREGGGEGREGGGEGRGRGGEGGGRGDGKGRGGGGERQGTEQIAGPHYQCNKISAYLQTTSKKVRDVFRCDVVLQASGALQESVPSTIFQNNYMYTVTQYLVLFTRENCHCIST